MEQQQQTKGIGKESQLSRIAAAVNPGSNTEANPESTKTMIQTFIKHFDSVALELIQEMDDDQEDLVKRMVEEITKLQTKNIDEFQKAIGKIVGITNKMIASNNPKMQQLGQGLQDQAKEELFKAKGITLTGDKDTFMNRLGREFGMDTEKEPVEKTRQGVGKLARGFVSDAKKGFKAGLKESFMPQGGMLDRVFTTDEDKRQRELAKLEQDAGETETESLADMFKKVIEQMLKQGKETPSSGKQPDPTTKPIERLTDLTDDQKKKLEEQGIAPASENDFSYRKDGKPVSIEQINKALAPVSSEQQEDAAGISPDNATAGMAAIGATLVALQANSDDSLEIFKESLEKLEFISKWIEDNGEGLLAGGGGGGGGGILDTITDIAGGAAIAGMLPSAATLATGGAIAAGAAGVAYGAYKGYTGYQDAKQKEEASNKEIDEKVSRGEMTQAQGLEAKDKTKKTGRIEKYSAVGEGVGIAAGAAGGATLGAMYGSALGPLGTVVGGAGGALVGGFLGGGGGKWLGEKAGQLTNWWQGDHDKEEMIDAKVKSGEISKAEGDKLKKDLKPSGKDKVVGVAKTALGLATNPLGTIGSALFGGEEKPKSAAEKKEGGMLSKIGNLMGDNKGKLLGTALGPMGMAAGALYDASKKTAKPETGKNVDGSIIEAGTVATRDKMKINVPPPTVINQGGGGQSAPTITAPGGVGNVRSDDPTWLRFQQKRAVA